MTRVKPVINCYINYAIEPDGSEIKPDLQKSKKKCATPIIKNELIKGVALTQLDAIPVNRSSTVVQKNAFCLHGSMSHLPMHTIEKICQYIDDHRSSWQKTVKKSENNLYIRASDTPGLPRSIQYNVDGSIFIHLTKAKQGDLLLGSGSYKNVKTAVEVATGSVFASAGLKSADDPEASNFAKVKGVKGFVQIAHRVVYDKNAKSKERLLMPLYNCGSLERVLSKGFALSSMEKQSIAVQLIDALAYAESHEMLHRDLKPGNVLVHYLPSGELKVVISDLGSMCEEDDIFERMDHCTTSWWASPEYAAAILKKDNEMIMHATTYKHDVWSLGLILYQIYIQPSLPWSSSTNEDDIFASQNLIVKTNWFPEPTDKYSMEHLIWEMLKNNPKDRISAIDAQGLLEGILTKGFSALNIEEDQDALFTNLNIEEDISVSPIYLKSTS